MIRIRPTRRLVTALVLATCLAASAFAAPQGVVNVNDAGSEELMLLPRIGEAVAERIVAFREENGPFASIEELMLVRGIGEATFERLERYVAVTGETTLSEKVPSKAPSKGGGSE